MAGDWIQVRRSLAKDGRIRIVSRSLRDTCHASVTEVFGALVTLWCIADEHADENGELLGWAVEDIDHEIGLPGFCNALPDCWMDISGEWVKLPNYQEHNGSTGKARAQAQKRKKAQREREQISSRNGHGQGVTREEKRREDITTKQTAVVDQPLVREKPKEPAATDFSDFKPLASTIERIKMRCPDIEKKLVKNEIPGFLIHAEMNYQRRQLQGKFFSWVVGAWEMSRSNPQGKTNGTKQLSPVEEYAARVERENRLISELNDGSLEKDVEAFPPAMVAQ